MGPGPEHVRAPGPGHGRRAVEGHRLAARPALQVRARVGPGPEPGPPHVTDKIAVPQVDPLERGKVLEEPVGKRADAPVAQAQPLQRGVPVKQSRRKYREIFVVRKIELHERRQRIEHPGRQIAVLQRIVVEIEEGQAREPGEGVRREGLSKRVAGKVERLQRAEPPERVRRQGPQAVAGEVERRDGGEPVEVARVERRDGIPREVEARERVEPREITRPDPREPGARRRERRQRREVGVAHRAAGCRPGPRHQRVADRGRAPADTGVRRRHPPVDQVVGPARERRVGRRRRARAFGRDDRGAGRDRDLARAARNPVRVQIVRQHRPGEHRHPRRGLAHVGRVARHAADLEREGRRPGHHHVLGERHLHLDRLARAVARRRGRRRHDRHRLHPRRAHHLDRERVGALEDGRGASALDGERDRVARRRQRLRHREAGGCRVLALPGVDLGRVVGEVLHPQVVHIRAEGPGLARRGVERHRVARHQTRLVRPRRRHRLESVDAGIAGEMELGNGDQRLEHPVRQRRDGVVAQDDTVSPAAPAKNPPGSVVSALLWT